jgi:hypothetical protein
MCFNNVFKFNLCQYMKVSGSTDVYFSVEAVDAKIDTSKLSLFSAAVSLYANISTFGHTELTLEHFTIVVTVDLAIGDHKIYPTFRIGGTLNYTYPCTHGRAVQVDGIKTCVEGAYYNLSAGSTNMMNRIQTVLSNSTCAAKPRHGCARYQHPQRAQHCVASRRRHDRRHVPVRGPRQ